MILLYKTLGAQDTVYFLDGEKRQGKVIEIGPDAVLMESNGEKKQIARQYIMLIRYKNGFFETFNRPAESKTISRVNPDNKETGSGRQITKAQFNNRLSFNSLALVNSDASLFYEFLVPRHKVGLTGMGAYNFNNATGFYNLQINQLYEAKKNYDLGISADVYSNNPLQGPSLFWGLMFKYTNISYTKISYIHNSSGSISVVNEGRVKAYNLATLFTVGLSHQWPERFFIKSFMGLGGCFLRGELKDQLNNANGTRQNLTINGTQFQLKGYMTLNIGYSF
mgnify:CR=1 FL=1